MRPFQSLLTTLLILGCSSPVDPGPIYPSYYLTQVDDRFLPIPWGEDGSVLIAASLRFESDPRPRQPAPANGTVQYKISIRRPDQTLQHSIVDLEYVIQNDELRINLCPPNALCITTTELVASVADPALELVLTHYVGGRAVSTYHYSVSLPE